MLGIFLSLLERSLFIGKLAFMYYSKILKGSSLKCASVMNNLQEEYRKPQMLSC